MPLRHTHEPDPILNVEVTVRRGTNVDRHRTTLRPLVWSHGQPYCGEVNRTRDLGTYTCTRPAGHPDWWKHVASDGWEVMSVWGGGDPPADGTLLDPEDGSDVDPADVIARDTIALGGVFKLRDRKNILQVIGGTADVMPRKDGLIDVVDLHTRTHRSLPIEEMVATDHVLTMDDLAIVVEVAQKLRMLMRDQAVENYHAGKWCEAGLQDGLRDLGLPRYVPTQSGTVSIQIPYEALSTAAISGIKKAVQDALDIAAIKKVAIDPENDDELNLRTKDLKVAVEGVHRR